MPEASRSDGPIWPPAFGDLKLTIIVGARLEVFGHALRIGQRDVAARPDVGSEQNRQKVDIGCPKPDTGQLHQLSSGSFIIQVIESRAVKFVCLDGLS